MSFCSHSLSFFVLSIFCFQLVLGHSFSPFGFLHSRSVVVFLFSFHRVVSNEIILSNDLSLTPSLRVFMFYRSPRFFHLYCIETLFSLLHFVLCHSKELIRSVIDQVPFHFFGCLSLFFQSWHYHLLGMYLVFTKFICSPQF